MFCQNCTQAAERAEMLFLSLVILTFDLWSCPSNSSERGTKHAFRVNLSQIRSAVPEIIHTRIKKQRLTAPKTEPSAAQLTACGKNDSCQEARCAALEEVYSEDGANGSRWYHLVTRILFGFSVARKALRAIPILN